MSGTALAAPFSGLYEVEIPVADQTATTRSAAMSDALRQVVVKISGKSAAAGNPAVKEALRNPARHVQQYSYRANEGSAAAELPLLLGLTYDSRGIDQLVQEAGLSPWSSARPLTMVWLAVETGGQRVLVGAGDRGLVKELLMKAAQRRGLPLRLPLLDATDKARVQADDVWSEVHETILHASQRYEAQAILVGRLGQTSGGRWQVRWILYKDGTAQRWNQTGDKVEPLVAYGIDMGTDFLATAQIRPVAVLRRSEEGLYMYMVVNGVRDMHSQRRVLDYLSSLRGVTGVQLEQVTGDSLRLRIASGTNETTFQEILAFDNRLVQLPESQSVPQSASGGLVQPGDRVYRLAP